MIHQSFTPLRSFTFSNVKIPKPIIYLLLEFLKKNQDKKTILLSEKVFDMGTREVVNTMIEENEHLKTGYSDETRQFQTHLINLLISSFEDKAGRYL